MKKTSFFLLALVCPHFLAIGQTASTPAGPRKMTFSVRELTKTNWNTPGGLAYVQVPGANLGVTSFELMDKYRVAYLSDASSEMYISNRASGKTEYTFHVSAAPRDFVYDQGEFYVLSGTQVSVYDVHGKQLKNTLLPETANGVNRIARFNKTTWLLLPSGNSMQIDPQTDKVNPLVRKGWVTASGNFLSTAIKANAFAVTLSMPDGKTLEKTIPSDKKVAGVYVVGCTNNRIVLDVQTYVSESPVSVERHLVSIPWSAAAISDLSTAIRIPDCYYVLSDKELDLESDGTVLEMITAPGGVYLFSLTEAYLAKAHDYPAGIKSEKYHFNDHLLQMKEAK